MNQYISMQTIRKQESASFAAAFTARVQPEAEHKCSMPSCQDKVWRDNFCWDHYQHKYYTGR